LTFWPPLGGCEDVAEMPTATVLVVNAGSSSLKVRVLGPDDEVLASCDAAAGHEAEVIAGFLDGAPEPDAAGHRVVHGGADLTTPVRLDAAVERHLEGLAELAPLHNPPALRGIRALHELRPDLPAVACFDTAFHSTLPAEAFTYAVPAAWSERWPLRRFGFHGLSHAYASRRAAELLRRPPKGLRLVTAHLGAGASLAAVAQGRSVDTTMGFTPLEGLAMATRSGSVDPGLLLWVQRHAGIDPASAEQALDREAGLSALSGRSGDMRELLAGVDEHDERCKLALAVYLHKLAAGVAAMVAAMGGLDALVFTGGVGENAPRVREAAVERLRFLGLELTRRTNAASQPADRVLSPAGSPAAVVVVAAREDLAIAREVRALLER
jgi:acetate kinase